MAGREVFWLRIREIRVHKTLSKNLKERDHLGELGANGKLTEFK
jgi:hypothetical protein